MKIALINENSQNSKNPMIEAALKKVVEPMGHTVFNYGLLLRQSCSHGKHIKCFPARAELATDLIVHRPQNQPRVGIAATRIQKQKMETFG